MTEEIAELAALRQKLAAKEAECKELHKQLHELRGHAQILQNKTVSEILCESLRAHLAAEGAAKLSPRDRSILNGSESRPAGEFAVSTEGLKPWWGSVTEGSVSPSIAKCSLN
jgi:hypothetical protein